MIQANDNAIIAVGWLSTAALAKMLGKSSPRTALGWCRRHGIAVARDGKWNFVKLVDVKAVLARLDGSSPNELDSELKKAFGT